MTPAEILAAAARRTLALPERGVDIALLDWGGNGPLALLHHANGFCKGVWGLVAWGLRTRFHVIAMDARGHGDSSKPEGPSAYYWHHFAEDLLSVTAALTDETNQRQLALALGHSFGGTSFIVAAKQRPELFERMLLLDPVIPSAPGVARDQASLDGLQKMIDGARRRRSVFSSLDEAREQWSKRSFFANCDPRALELYLLDGLRKRDDGQFELKCPGEIEGAVFAGGPTIDIYAAAEGLEPQTLILSAARGNFPSPLHEMIAASMKRGRVEIVPTGHLVPLERPDLVVTAALQ